MPLTDSSRVEALLGRTLTSDENTRADLLLEMASDQVVGAVGQTFTKVTDETVTLVMSEGELVWPQRPVTALGTVTLDPDGAALVVPSSQYRWDSRTFALRWVEPPTTSVIYERFRNWSRYSGKATFTGIDHGYATIPGDVQNAVAGAVAALVQQQKANPNGFRQQRLDDREIQYHFRDGTSLAVALDVGAGVLEELEENYGLGAWSPRVAP